jgi:hypothetical protein
MPVACYIRIYSMFDGTRGTVRVASQGADVKFSHDVCQGFSFTYPFPYQSKYLCQCTVTVATDFGDVPTINNTDNGGSVGSHQSTAADKAAVTTMSATTTTGEPVDDNPYLALRAAKIARNEKKLSELGLTTKAGARKPAATIRRRSPKVPAPKPQPTRRSKRGTGQPVPPTKELPEDVVSIASLASRKRARPAKKAGSKSAYVFPENSVRLMHLPVGDTVDKLLGRTMEKTGKAFVVQKSLNGRADASFNKYCGVQEWGNDAIFLWVNVGKKDDDVVNDFLGGGRQITWFGGSKMHNETPAIQKLLRVGKEATTKSNPDGGDDGIVLWCRHYNTPAKTYHPYTCLGRLSYESHVVGSRPLQFIWNMLDYDRLLKHKDEAVRQRFLEIIDL